MFQDYLLLIWTNLFVLDLHMGRIIIRHFKAYWAWTSTKNKWIFSCKCNRYDSSWFYWWQSFVWFKDDHSTFKILFYMKHKSNVFQLFKRLQHISFIATNNWIKKLTTNFGKEFTRKEFEDFFFLKIFNKKPLHLIV